MQGFRLGNSEWLAILRKLKGKVNNYFINHDDFSHPFLFKSAIMMAANSDMNSLNRIRLFPFAAPSLLKRGLPFILPSFFRVVLMIKKAALPQQLSGGPQPGLSESRFTPSSRSRQARFQNLCSTLSLSSAKQKIGIFVMVHSQ